MLTAAATGGVAADIDELLESASERSLSDAGYADPRSPRYAAFEGLQSGRTWLGALGDALRLSLTRDVAQEAAMADDMARVERACITLDATAAALTRELADLQKEYDRTAAEHLAAAWELEQLEAFSGECAGRHATLDKLAGEPPPPADGGLYPLAHHLLEREAYLRELENTNILRGATSAMTDIAGVPYSSLPAALSPAGSGVGVGHGRSSRSPRSSNSPYHRNGPRGGQDGPGVTWRLMGNTDAGAGVDAGMDDAGGGPQQPGEREGPGGCTPFAAAAAASVLTYLVTSQPEAQVVARAKRRARGEPATVPSTDTDEHLRLLFHAAGKGGDVTKGPTAGRADLLPHHSHSHSAAAAAAPCVRGHDLPTTLAAARACRTRMLDALMRVGRVARDGDDRTTADASRTNPCTACGGPSGPGEAVEASSTVVVITGEPELDALIAAGASGYGDRAKASLVDELGANFRTAQTHGSHKHKEEAAVRLATAAWVLHRRVATLADAAADSKTVAPVVAGFLKSLSRSEVLALWAFSAPVEEITAVMGADNTGVFAVAAAAADTDASTFNGVGAAAHTTAKAGEKAQVPARAGPTVTLCSEIAAAHGLLHRSLHEAAAAAAAKDPPPLLPQAAAAAVPAAAYLAAPRRSVDVMSQNSTLPPNEPPRVSYGGVPRYSAAAAAAAAVSTPQQQPPPPPSPPPTQARAFMTIGAASASANGGHPGSPRAGSPSGATSRSASPGGFLHSPRRGGGGHVGHGLSAVDGGVLPSAPPLAGRSLSPTPGRGAAGTASSAYPLLRGHQFITSKGPTPLPRSGPAPAAPEDSSSCPRCGTASGSPRGGPTPSPSAPTIDPDLGAAVATSPNDFPPEQAAAVLADVGERWRYVLATVDAVAWRWEALAQGGATAPNDDADTGACAPVASGSAMPPVAPLDERLVGSTAAEWDHGDPHLRALAAQLARSTSPTRAGGGGADGTARMRRRLQQLQAENGDTVATDGAGNVPETIRMQAREIAAALVASTGVAGESTADPAASSGDGTPPPVSPRQPTRSVLDVCRDMLGDGLSTASNGRSSPGLFDDPVKAAALPPPPCPYPPEETPVEREARIAELLASGKPIDEVMAVLVPSVIPPIEPPMKPFEFSFEAGGSSPRASTPPTVRGASGLGLGGRRSTSPFSGSASPRGSLTMSISASERRRASASPRRASSSPKRAFTAGGGGGTPPLTTMFIRSPRARGLQLTRGSLSPRERSVSFPEAFPKPVPRSRAKSTPGGVQRGGDGSGFSDDERDNIIVARSISSGSGAEGDAGAHSPKSEGRSTEMSVERLMRQSRDNRSGLQLPESITRRRRTEGALPMRSRSSGTSSPVSPVLASSLQGRRESLLATRSPRAAKMTPTQLSRRRRLESQFGSIELPSDSPRGGIRDPALSPDASGPFFLPGVLNASSYVFDDSHSEAVSYPATTSVATVVQGPPSTGPAARPPLPQIRRTPPQLPKEHPAPPTPTSPPPAPLPALPPPQLPAQQLPAVGPPLRLRVTDGYRRGLFSDVKRGDWVTALALAGGDPTPVAPAAADELERRALRVVGGDEVLEGGMPANASAAANGAEDVGVLADANANTNSDAPCEEVLLTITRRWRWGGAGTMQPPPHSHPTTSDESGECAARGPLPGEPPGCPVNAAAFPYPYSAGALFPVTAFLKVDRVVVREVAEDDLNGGLDRGGGGGGPTASTPSVRDVDIPHTPMRERCGDGGGGGDGVHTGTRHTPCHIRAARLSRSAQPPRTPATGGRAVVLMATPRTTPQRQLAQVAPRRGVNGAGSATAAAAVTPARGSSDGSRPHAVQPPALTPPPPSASQPQLLPAGVGGCADAGAAGTTATTPHAPPTAAPTATAPAAKKPAARPLGKDTTATAPAAAKIPKEKPAGKKTAAVGKPPAAGGALPQQSPTPCTGGGISSPLVGGNVGAAAAAASDTGSSHRGSCAGASTSTADRMLRIGVRGAGGSGKATSKQKQKQKQPTRAHPPPQLLERPSYVSPVKPSVSRMLLGSTPPAVTPKTTTPATVVDSTGTARATAGRDAVTPAVATVAEPAAAAAVATPPVIAEASAEGKAPCDDDPDARCTRADSDPPDMATPVAEHFTAARVATQLELSGAVDTAQSLAAMEEPSATTTLGAGAADTAEFHDASDAGADGVVPTSTAEGGAAAGGTAVDTVDDDIAAAAVVVAVAPATPPVVAAGDPHAGARGGAGSAKGSFRQAPSHSRVVSSLQDVESPLWPASSTAVSTAYDDDLSVHVMYPEPPKSAGSAQHVKLAAGGDGASMSNASTNEEDNDNMVAGVAETACGVLLPLPVIARVQSRGGASDAALSSPKGSPGVPSNASVSSSRMLGQWGGESSFLDPPRSVALDSEPHTETEAAASGGTSPVRPKDMDSLLSPHWQQRPSASPSPTGAASDATRRISRDAASETASQGGVEGGSVVGDWVGEATYADFTSDAGGGGGGGSSVDDVQIAKPAPVLQRTATGSSGRRRPPQRLLLKQPPPLNTAALTTPTRGAFCSASPAGESLMGDWAGSPQFIGAASPALSNAQQSPYPYPRAASSQSMSRGRAALHSPLPPRRASPSMSAAESLLGDWAGSPQFMSAPHRSPSYGGIGSGDEHERARAFVASPQSVAASDADAEGVAASRGALSAAMARVFDTAADAALRTPRRGPRDEEGVLAPVTRRETQPGGPDASCPSFTPAEELELVDIKTPLVLTQGGQGGVDALALAKHAPSEAGATAGDSGGLTHDEIAQRARGLGLVLHGSDTSGQHTIGGHGTGTGTGSAAGTATEAASTPATAPAVPTPPLAHATRTASREQTEPLRLPAPVVAVGARMSAQPPPPPATRDSSTSPLMVAGADTIARVHVAAGDGAAQTATSETTAAPPGVRRRTRLVKTVHLSWHGPLGVAAGTLGHASAPRRTPSQDIADERAAAAEAARRSRWRCDASERVIDRVVNAITNETAAYATVGDLWTMRKAVLDEKHATLVQARDALSRTSAALGRSVCADVVRNRVAAQAKASLEAQLAEARAALAAATEEWNALSCMHEDARTEPTAYPAALAQLKAVVFDLGRDFQYLQTVYEGVPQAHAADAVAAALAHIRSVIEVSHGPQHGPERWLLQTTAIAPHIAPHSAQARAACAALKQIVVCSDMVDGRVAPDVAHEVVRNVEVMCEMYRELACGE